LSHYILRFIPEDIYFSLNHSELSKIENLNWDGNNPSFIFSERMLFADAGRNFESVKCPNCNSNLAKWWGTAMDSAFSEEYGFVDIEINTPCCNYEVSLHELNYYFPQGFYRIMIEVVQMTGSRIMSEEIVRNLFSITGVSWRAIHACY